MDSTESRQKRSKYFYTIIISITLIVLLSIVYSLRTMIVPAVVAGLLAYACIPILRKLQRKGIPNGIAVLILLGVFVLCIVLLTDRIRDAIPDENDQLELRVRVEYKILEKYNDFMGGEKNFIMETISQEIDPLFNDFVGLLSLSRKEQILFSQYFEENKDTDPDLERYYEYHLTNLARQNKIRAMEKAPQEKEGYVEPIESKDSASSGGGIISQVVDIVSTWLVAPFVFLFLLVDNGEIKRSLISMVPNSYFEMTITIIDNVDEAIGKYLRGTLLECSLVGLTFMICLFLIGIDAQWALIIGIVAGVANAIPFLGPAIGLVVGASYALIAEGMEPVLPFIDPDNILIWVLVSVVIAQLMDNSVFQPIVLGSAVSLHPLIVIIGVMGGSILFGIAGMLFAIPTIVVVKVIFSTLLHELKAYNLIE